MTEKHHREDRIFLLLSVFIGIFSGLAIVCFRYAIDWCRIHLLGSGMHVSPWRLILAPTLTGLLVSLLVIYVFPSAKSNGVNQIKGALFIYNGYMPLRAAVGKFITCALAIGSGQSLGPEDPSLLIGASIASALGRLLRLSRSRMRLIAPVGAAAGLAAAFNAPISAVLFVIEEVIGRWSAGILGSVVLAAVSSVVVMRFFLGSQSLFQIPGVQLQQPSELIAYAILGILGGVASVALSSTVALLRPRVKQLPRWTYLIQPACAGLLVGCIGACGAPQVMGAGYVYIDEAIHGQFTWQFLAMLAVLKIVATLLSFLSGTPGGMFAPTLFIGAMFGAAVGGAEHALLPQMAVSPSTYALVGMGVLFAGFLRAPITSVFMILEMSGNYSIVVPVMVANTFAYVIPRALHQTALFDLISSQDGVELPSMEEMREESILRVEDAMKPHLDLVLEASEVSRWREQLIGRDASEPLLVRLQPRGWSNTSEEEIASALEEDESGQILISTLADRQIPCLHPDQPLHVALRYVYQWPIVPVVNRADFRKLEGIITRGDVLGTYSAVL